MIDLTKQYKTINGHPVVVYGQHNGIVYGRAGTIPASWCEEDLVETSPWDHLKKGDLVRVRDFITEGWQYRIFYKSDENGPMTIIADGTGLHWEYCEKINIEDLP